MKLAGAITLVVLTSLIVAIGCNNKPQGNGVTCQPLPGPDMAGTNMAAVDGGSVGCFYPATLAAQRTQCGDVTDYCDKSGTTTPSLACLGKSSTAPATPAKVTLTGFVHAFSSGPDTNNLSVTVYDASMTNGMDPLQGLPVGSTTAALDPTTQRACDADPMKGCTIPSAAGCTAPTCNDGLGGRPDNNKYCYDLGNGQGECHGRLRWEARYSIDNVPTNRQLVVRVSGTSGTNDPSWATTVAFNVVLATNDKTCASPTDTDCIDLSNPSAPKYQLNVNSLSRSDYVNIPTVAGLPGGISGGKGAVAGEVHDCDNVRVANVEVTTTPPAERYTYFNGQPYSTLPDVSRAAIGTDRLGLFAALNQTPGKVHVDTAGELTAGGDLISFGTVDAFVYANTVTIVNINGGRGTR